MSVDPFIEWAERKQAEYRQTRLDWCEAIQWPITRRKRARKPEPGALDLPETEPEG